jgi:hypothetical protein
MTVRNGVPRVCRANGLDWQTAAHDSFDLQWLSGALANHSPPATGRIRLFPLQKAFVGRDSLLDLDPRWRQ